MDDHILQIDKRNLVAKTITRDPENNLPTIVFLHDALGSIEQWKKYPDQIGMMTGCNVMLYDRFGHGASDPEPDPPDETFLDKEALVILPEVLHQLGIDKCILYGHSDGATIALIYASHIKTEAIILEAAHVLIEEKTRIGVLDTMLRKDVIVDKLKKYHGEKAIDLFDNWSGIWSGVLMQDWSIEHVLKRIDVPTLIIQGKGDNYGTEKQVQKIAGGISGKSAVFMLEDCGHTPYKEKTKLVSEQVLAFFESLKLNGESED